MFSIKLTSVFLLTLISANSAAEVWKSSQVLAPQYPIEAARKGLSGCVSVQYFIDENGKVLMAEALASSDPIFEESAVREVREAKYELVDGKQAKTERRIVQLDYTIGENTDTGAFDASKCYATLTNESANIEDFRQARLNQAIYLDNVDQWPELIKPWLTVLTPYERENFERHTALIMATEAKNAQDNPITFVRRVNGLNYTEIMNVLVDKPPIVAMAPYRDELSKEEVLAVLYLSC